VIGKEDSTAEIFQRKKMRGLFSGRSRLESLAQDCVRARVEIEA
jgi:hypothetical protein